MMILTNTDEFTNVAKAEPGNITTSDVVLKLEK